MSKYVGFRLGKVHESHVISEYYCGGCGWPVTDHDSFCPECGGAFHECDASNLEDENATLGPKITGNTSDGYHTFNELYHHRAVLFSVIVRDHQELAWKSMRHHDGTMYDGMFIVGIETPEGQATYHYDIDPYWDMFNCKELDQAPEWDGHTPSEAIERIATLGSSNVGRYVGLRQGEYWERTENSNYYCGGCGWKVTDHDSYCPECGGALHNATLRTCHNVWDIELTGRLRFQCSECGAVSLEITPNYCPICGRKVVGE